MQSLPSADEIRASIAVDSLREFIGQAWPLVEPGTQFRSNWHIDVICEHLEAQTRGEMPKLLINVPPRHMKSLTVCVFWPCWEWLTRPQTRWMFAAYAQILSTRDSVKCRNIIESQGLSSTRGTDGRDLTMLERIGYQGLLRLLGQSWDLKDDQNLKTRFENTETGYRLSTSVGGSATGEGGDRLVIDDPHKADEVTSDVMRENVLDWHDQTWSTRLNDRKTGTQTVIMQRLHEEDLAGHIIDFGDWHHLCLPAEYEPTHPFVWPDDPRDEEGELLWPGHVGPDEIDGLKKALGSYGYAGQFQQRPAPAEGGIFKTSWWRYYPADWLEGDEWPHGAPAFSRVWQSWDTALKEKTSSDYTVGQVWAQDLSDRYLLRQVRGRWSFTEALEQIIQQTGWVARRFPKHASHSVFVENAAMGPELINAARRKVQGVIPVNADRDKVSRAFAVTPQLEAGHIHVPGQGRMTSSGLAPDPGVTPAWAQELIAECAAFPNAANDDQVDALTQGLDPRRWNTQRKPNTQRQRSVTGGYNRGNV